MTTTTVCKSFGRWSAVWALLAAGLFLAGCHTDSSRHFADVPGLEPAPAATGPTTTVGTTNAGGTPATMAMPFPSDDEVYKLKPGDSVTITYVDAPMLIPPFVGTIKEDGTVTLIENQTFTAKGKTRRELEQEIHDRYVPNLIRKLTVSVELQQQTRFYYVLGEVKAPNRQVYLTRIHLLEAIASAGDFTDFAKKTAVELTRADGRKFVINCKKALKDPTLNLEVFPNDKIWVPKRWL